MGKRIISLICLCSVIASLFMLNAAATANLSDYEKAHDFLLKIGVISKDETYLDYEKEISRGEFSEILYNSLGKNAEYSEAKQLFLDVPSKSMLFDYVGTLTTRGIIDGAGDGMFYPNALITPKQAEKLAVSFLGYKAIAEAIGGFPYGYSDIARRLKLPSISGDTLNMGNALTLVSAMLNTKPYDYSTFSENKLEFSQDSETYLNKYFDIYYIEGIVSANELTALTDKDSLNKGCIKIENLVL